MPLHRLPTDRLFHVAVAAGPLVWVVLYLLYRPQPSWQQIVENSASLLLLCLIYPLIEELAFRGAVQGWLLRQRFGSVSVAGITGANILASCLFAAAHLFYHPPLWAALVFVPSLVFGWFRDRYQSVVPAIVLHILYNSGYFLLFSIK